MDSQMCAGSFLFLLILVGAFVMGRKLGYRAGLETARTNSKNLIS